MDNVGKAGLTNSEVNKRLSIYGSNELEVQKTHNIWKTILNVMKEPMFLLLIITSLMYFFISKEFVEGMVMIMSVVIMMSIEIFQEYKTDKSLEKLRELSQPRSRVRRNGSILEIDSSQIVPGDIMLISEGDRIAADGKIIEQSDLAIDESSLTGESDIIYKSTQQDSQNYFKRNQVYQGTNVVLGTAEIEVTATGRNTETGKIGTKIAEAPQRPTPLEIQIKKVTKYFSIFAIVALIGVFIVNYYRNFDIYDAVIAGITFAIGVIPEEFPVVLTIFLSMGAYRLSRQKSLIRKLSSVETLGSVSVLCVDKTGTLTENNMTVSESFYSKKFSKEDFLKIATLSCEPVSYDPMEQAILNYCGEENQKLFSNELLHEYPFSSEYKRMGHVWQLEGEDKVILVSKGSPETVLNLCQLSSAEREAIETQQSKFAQQGMRVIAFAKADYVDEIPSNLEYAKLDFVGLMSFIDPPRKEVSECIKICNRAGIRVIMITGDNPITASAIGRKIGLLNCEKVITGQEIESMSELELVETVKEMNIFSRVIPEQKLKIIKAIKKSGEVVAMTGDGVNDAPALKYADIGIAMGNRGTNVAKEASDMVLLDDNFSTIVETIKDGRRIYDNISKAIRYILTFKIPIALIVLFIPLLKFPPMILPIHIVILELIINPICAIILERQPAERNVMNVKPRNPSINLIDKHTLSRVIIQGTVIFLAIYLAYTITLNITNNEYLARSLALTVMVVSDILLVCVAMSDSMSAWNVIKFFVKDRVFLGVLGAIIVGLGIFIYFPLANQIVKTAPLSISQFLLGIFIAIVSVLWYEIVKFYKNKKLRQRI